MVFPLKKVIECFVPFVLGCESHISHGIMEWKSGKQAISPFKDSLLSYSVTNSESVEEKQSERQWLSMTSGLLTCLTRMVLTYGRDKSWTNSLISDLTKETSMV